MNTLSNLKRSKGSVKNRKRKGRGQGSGLGVTAGRGDKGQKSRSGGYIRLGFEGGQMPLQRRVPKRGFNNYFRKEYFVVDLDFLARKFPEGGQINLSILKDQGFCHNVDLFKITGNGKLGDVKYDIIVDSITKTAQETIEAKGGKVTINKTVNDYMEVSLAKLNKNFSSDDDEVNITFEDMRAKGLIPKSKSKVRITSVGRINKKFNVEAHQISRQAYTTIKKNGGSVKYLESANHILKVNFKKLQKWFPAGGTVTPEDLQKLGVLKDNQIVSLVNKGRVNCKYKIQVHKASKSARRKIEAKGGEVNIIE